MIIKNVETKEKLNEYYHFFTKVFYEDAVKHNEHYYPMFNAYTKIAEQYEKDPTLLLYIEENGEIVATLAAKDSTNDSITLEALTVLETCRGKGYATLLVNEMENRLAKKGITNISLGARIRACKVYMKNKYSPTLLVQVNDFATIDLVKKANKYNYKIVNEYQNEVCGAVFFEVDSVNEEVVDYFEKNVPTAHANYIFTKKLIRTKEKNK